MLNRLTHTLQGFVLGTVLTLTGCGLLYLHTHDIHFTSTATNETEGQQTAMAIEKLMPVQQEKSSQKTR